jgi:hypothetical protein
MRYFALTAVMSLALAAPALAEEWDFMLTNESGKEIKTLEVSPAGTATWQPNKVDPEIGRVVPVKPAGRTTVHFDKGESQCRYDIKATFADDTNAVWSNINVCDNAYVTLRYKNGAPSFAVK